MTSTNCITFTAKKFNGLSLPADREIGFVSVFKKKIGDVGTFTLSLSDASLKDLRSGQSVIVALERSIGDNVKAACAYDIGRKATTASVNLSKPINDNDLSLTTTYKQQGNQFILQESWKFWDKKNKLSGSYNFANEEAIFTYDYIKDVWTLSAMYNIQQEAPTLTVSKKQGKGTAAVSMGVRDRSVAMSWNRKPFKAVLKGNVGTKGGPAVGVSSKMKQLVSIRTLEIPEGVTVEVKARKVRVKGPRGTLSRDFKHLAVDMYLFEEEGQKKLKVDAHLSKRKALASLRTCTSHVQNMITGVTKGFEYKMRLVYAHFPININIENAGAKVEIRNFLGEKRVRVINMLPGVKIERSSAVKDELVLTGNDIEHVSKSCALIHQVCLVKHKDIRKFLDGIYVSGKSTILKDE